eukprot:gene3428-4308_t
MADGEDDSIQAQKVCEIGAFPYDAFTPACRKGYGVFPGASMFNHSCVPNVCHEFYDCPGGGLLVFRALRLIPE